MRSASKLRAATEPQSHDQPAPVFDAPTDNSSEARYTENNTAVNFPTIGPSDYQSDEEFQNMYTYLMFGELTGNSRIDKTTLIMADRYLIENDDLLYRIDLPRQQKLAQIKPTVKKLCVPCRFRHNIIPYFHNDLGHYAAQSLFHTIATRFYWKSLFADVNTYCKTCEICQRTKINYSHTYVPLHPHPVPNEIGTRLAIDHKVLTRTTEEGNTAVLVVVEEFSSTTSLVMPT